MLHKMYSYKNNSSLTHYQQITFPERATELNGIILRVIGKSLFPSSFYLNESHIKVFRNHQFLIYPRTSSVSYFKQTLFICKTVC
jgi:hypothetical protein